MPPLDIARARLRAQRLVGPPLHSPVEVVGWLGAVQAQDYLSAKWALSVRTPGATSVDIDQALNRGDVLRTHAMRPTWHLVRPEDIRWILALTSPRVHRVNGSRYRALGLDAVTLTRSLGVLEVALRDGNHLTRNELKRYLDEAGIPTEGQQLAYVGMHAELEGLICSGAIKGKHHTYALLDERVAPTPPKTREEALAELARRYLMSHGPATPHDFSWWSGLTVSDCRSALALLGAEVTTETVDGVTYWLMADGATSPLSSSPVVHLLPDFDEHVVAYRDHGPTLHPDLRDRNAGIGEITSPHLIAVDGLVIGDWRRVLRSREAEIHLRLPLPMDEAVQARIDAEAERMSRFLNGPVSVHHQAPTHPPAQVPGP